MKTLTWFFAALLGAAGITAILATANAQSLVTSQKTQRRWLTNPEKLAAATLISPCWNGPLAGLVSAKITRGNGAATNVLTMTLFALRPLDKAAAWAAALSGQTVLGGGNLREDATCVLNASQTTTLGALCSSLGTGTVDTVVVLSLDKGPQGVSAEATWLLPMDQPTFNANMDAGNDVTPTGTVQ